MVNTPFNGETKYHRPSSHIKQ